MKEKEVSKDFSQYMLYNTENYNKNINNTLQEIIPNFMNIMTEYMKFISEKITMKKKAYYLFIVERGIDTLIHVFSMIFYYTKNLPLTIYHTQKAYYFYIEFIEQISDDNITFLQLSSRDAVLFVYKKTIYDLNNEYKKNMNKLTEAEEEVFEIIRLYTQIYKKTIIFLINHNEFIYDKKKENINSFCEKMQVLNNNLNKGKLKANYVKCINEFIQLLIHKQVNINDFFNITQDFVRQLQTKKKTIEDTTIISKIHELNTCIDENELDVLTTNIFN